MTTSTDVRNLVSAYTSWVSAFNNWVTDDANSSQGLVTASESLSLAFTPFVSGNSSFATAANDIGVPVALNAFKLDVQAFNLATSEKDQHGAISAALSLVSDIGGATAGVAAIAAATQLGANEPLDAAAAVSATISAVAAGAKIAYDAGANVNTLLQNINNLRSSGFLGEFDGLQSTGQNVTPVADQIQTVIVDASQAAENGDVVALTSNNLTLSFTVATAPTLKTLANFNASNGANPDGSLVIDAAGDLFGVTQANGSGGDGTVFEIANARTLSTLASFNGIAPSGDAPEAGLLADRTRGLVRHDELWRG